MTPQDGVKHIVSEYQGNPSGDGFALVILDLETFQRVSVRQIVLEFKKELKMNSIPYNPKIVNLSSMRVTNSKSMLNAQCIDYQLNKPVKLEDFMRMSKALKLNFGGINQASASGGRVSDRDRQQQHSSKDLKDIILNESENEEE